MTAEKRILRDPHTGQDLAQFYEDGALVRQECRACRQILPAQAFHRARYLGVRPGDKRSACTPCVKAARRARDAAVLAAEAA
ncbi:hypothetical protein GCM10023081_38240 [Arthrobacter ginkgonis]|uniref:Uncharacterized protein n=1 Tax=Arthrobacter ginkgonis TaxID=1630594 RepID=A0ABP7D0V7_9MICC